MGRGEFYREWLRRAFSGKIAIAQAACGLIAVVVAAARWAAARYPVMSDWIPSVDQATVVVFVSVFLATVLLGFILAPYDMHTAETSRANDIMRRVEHLEAAATPQIRFAHGGTLYPSQFPGLPPGDCRLYRLGIENASTGPLHDVEAKISLRPRGQEPVVTNRPVKDTDGKSAWDMNPETTKYVDVLAARPSKVPPRIYTAPYAPGLAPPILNPGTYDVVVEASCKEARKITGRFTLLFRDDGSVDWREEKSA